MSFTCGMRALAVAAIGLMTLAGCNQDSRLAVENEKSGGLWAILVRSSAFEDQGAIPAKYSAKGGNVSPALKWNAGPSGTKEYVVIVQDTNSGGDRPATHWLVYGIPAGTTSLPEGSAGGFKQGQNFKGEVGYIGPEDTGSKHEYHFQVLALDRPLDAAEGAIGHELADKYQGWVLAKGQLIGTYEK